MKRDLRNERRSDTGKTREWVWRERYISGCLLDIEGQGREAVVRGTQQDRQALASMTMLPSQQSLYTSCELRLRGYHHPRMSRLDHEGATCSSCTTMVVHLLKQACFVIVVVPEREKERGTEREGVLRMWYWVAWESSVLFERLKYALRHSRYRSSDRELPLSWALSGMIF